RRRPVSTLTEAGFPEDPGDAGRKRTPGNKENQSLSVTCGHSHPHSPVSDTCDPCQMSLSRAPRLAEGQVTRGAAVLRLGLWAVLAPVQCSQGRPSWRYISSELVIPRKELHRGKGVQTPGWLSYSLRFGGQRHVIHMRRKKLFWPGHLLLMTQDDQGALQMDYPFIPSD
ncbi:hypothetical protein EI555_006607, partial [Monodon monoceros]